MFLARRLPKASLPISLGALSVLLGLLATLQYRWAGELSEAERIRMRAWTKASAESFCRDFDREVTRAFLRLQLDPEALRTRDFSAFARRHERWRRSTAHAGLVKGVFLIEIERGAGLHLSRFDALRLTFGPMDWPPDLLAIRARVEEQARSIRERAEDLARGNFIPDRGARHGLADVIAEDVPALVIPVLPNPGRVLEGEWRGARLPLGLVPPSAFVAVVIDLGYAGDRLLPALAERHFGAGELAYNLAIVRRDDPLRVIWRSSPDARPATPGDAAAGMLNLRLEEAIQEDFEDVGPPAIFSSVRSKRSLGSSGGGSRIGALLGRARSHSEYTGHWRLVAVHRAGSVDAVVAEARFRNLVVGFGILVLLGTSVALVVVSAQRASDLAERQMEFVAGVSHELRTPIAVIGSAAENLADGIVEGGAQVRRYGSVLRAEARRLAEMVEQVLEFAGASSGQPAQRAESIDVEGLIEQALQTYTVALREGAFVVQKDVDPGLPAVHGDTVALVRALKNLVGNALKHASEGRWVGVRASASESRTEVLVSVEDRGNGIPAAELPHVFDAFFRGQCAVTAQVHGFGLGLALVSRVAEAHGGRVSVVSAPGRGSTFTLRLPALPPRATAVPQPETGDGVPHPAR